MYQDDVCVAALSDGCRAHLLRQALDGARVAAAGEDPDLLAEQHGSSGDVALPAINTKPLGER